MSEVKNDAYWADWLVDAVATATQDRRFLRGDPECDSIACEAIQINGLKAIENAAKFDAQQMRAYYNAKVAMRLQAENERLRDTLAFYANPRGHILDSDIPDFYDEMDFGSRARAALGDRHE